MKTVVLSMISIAATIAAMTACTSESDPVDQIEAKVPIELNAGVIEVSSKAVVNKGDAFEAQVIASATQGDYTTSSWNGDIAVNSNGKVTFAPIQYYPTDGSTMYMTGYSPRAIATNGIVAYTIEGNNDIMVSQEESGSKTDKTDKALAFEHLLTQLQIKVIAADAAAITAWGTITSIEVVNASTSVELNLGTKKLAAAAVPAVKNVRVDKDLTTNPVTLPNLANSEQAASAGSVMVLPSDTKYQLLIKTEKNTTGITVDPTVTTTVASTAYEITLTFKTANVDAIASAGEWKTVSGGTGTVE